MLKFRGLSRDARSWPKCCYHRGVRFDVRPVEQLNAIRHAGEDAVYHRIALLILYPFQRFLDRLRLAGQVDDQRLFADRPHRRERIAVGT